MTKTEAMAVQMITETLQRINDEWDRYDPAWWESYTEITLLNVRYLLAEDSE